MENGVLGSLENPIKCEGPSGERAYLDRLLGPDNQFLTYKRIGSRGGRAGNVLDRYQIESLDRSFQQELYFDMYCNGYEEEEAPPLFSFIVEDKENLNNEFTQMIEKLRTLSDEYGRSECSRFGYIWSKSKMIAHLGPMLYASRDAFAMPQKNFDLAELVRCCKDVRDHLNGAYQHQPIQFSSAQNITQFFKTIHYIVSVDELNKIDSTTPQLLKIKHKMMQDETSVWVQLIS